MNTLNKLICLFFCLINIPVVLAEALPDPLSLQQAIELAGDLQHYQLIEAEASILAAQSVVEQAEASLGFKAQLEIEAAYIEPSRIAIDQSSNDSRVSLRMTKPIYNFGSSAADIQAAQTEQLAIQNHMPYIIGLRKIDIAKQFFEVILSDLKYAWDNESMAVAYIRFESAQDRHALSQVSDVDLLEAENSYIDILHQRQLSEINQRHSRAVLAELLNRPTELPSNLKFPLLDFSDNEIVDYPELLEKIMLSNPQVSLEKKRLEAASQRISAAAKKFGPRLDAEVELSEYARLTGSNDDWRAQLNLVIPLYENSSIKKDVSMARAAWLKQRASLLNIENNLRKRVLALWQKNDVLSKRKKQLETSQEFRELSLDKSRALYEMEVQTNLGSSLVAISEIQYKKAKNDFELFLARMQLRLLSGETNLF
ncbi:MAG: TolC family protein [Gammaproteobacteria bacterium]|nr:TolC family protein [Gammaproteobacteria bacterium]